LCLLVVGCYLQNGRYIFAKVKVFQRGLNMFARYCFLRILFRNLVGFGGYEGDEFDTAFDQEVARVFRKGHARVVV